MPAHHEQIGQRAGHKQAMRVLTWYEDEVMPQAQALVDRLTGR
jgi:hypothetical protein